MTLQPLVSTPALVLYFVTAAAAVAAWVVRTRASGWGRALRGVVAGSLALFVGVGLMGPAVAEESPALTSNIEIVFAVDRTGSMAAEDGPDGGTRLKAVKEDIVEVVSVAPESRYAIVTWDSSARVELPFTSDASAVVSFADALHQEVSEFSTGSTLDRPVAQLLDLLENAAEARPGNVRYLIVMSDGEDTQWDGVDAVDQTGWEAVGELIDGGMVVGYGTEAGGPMGLFLPGGAGSGDYMVDETGQTAISKLDEASLSEVAEALGVPLLVNPTVEEVAAQVEGVTDLAETIEDDRRVNLTYRYHTWVPALAAGVVAALALGAFTALVTRWKQTDAI